MASKKKLPVQNIISPLVSFDLGNAGAKIRTDDLALEFRSIVGLSGGGAGGVYRWLPDELRDQGWRVSVNPRRANADGSFEFLLQRERAMEQANA